MTTSERLIRADALYRLLNILPGEDFGAGRAACTDADPELFFPVSEHETNRIAAAKSVCQFCPIQGSCLQFALRNGEDTGIWGGLTADERRQVRLLRRNDNETEGVAA